MRTWIAIYAAALAALTVGVAAGTALLFRATAPSDSIERIGSEYAFNVVAWEMRHLPEKWLYKVGGLVRGDAENDEEALRRYFEITAEIRRLEREGDGDGAVDDLEEERAALENRVEDIIEGRVTAVLEDEGLMTGPPPFTDLGLVFPPVDFEFDAPPRVLAVSPRDRIELERSYLLRPGIPREEVEEIEREAEVEGDSSALVVQTGGVATYPSVLADLDDYEGLVDTVFHEWIHQYLLMYPLGRSYFNSGETRTLNESVANIAGSELARVYLERYGRLEAEPAVATPSPTTAAEAAFDFTAEMRALRTEVEALLAGGEIDEAEALMAEKRDYFEEKGRYIRRLNQAFFAHYGFYADTGASIDPIGPGLQDLLERSGSPGEFVRRAAGITSRGNLEEVLQTPSS
jgi:hypothetical protein